MSFFWRVFATNAALLVAAAVLLGVTPVTISAPIALAQAAVLVVGLTVILVANLVLLRPSFAPLERIVRRMRSVDLLRPGQRLAVEGPREVAELVRAFNEMLDRLEAERRASAARAVAAQEEERLRVSRGLHDEVGQRMTAVLLHLKRASEGLPAGQRAALAEAQEDVRESLEEVRRVARALRPEALDDLGLVSALRALSTSFTDRTGLRVEQRFAAGRLPPLTSEGELALYRVAQESLTNVARHADATRVELVLEPSARSVILRVVDNGRGLDGGAGDGTGGLRGMRERALMVGAVLAVEPGPDAGTEVRLEVPEAGAVP